MVQLSRWKILLIVFVSLMGFVYSAPNLLDLETRQWLRDNLPGWMPTQAINLGLDLRGGAHLLYRVDTAAVFAEQADLMVQDLRTALRENRIAYSRIGAIQNGVRLTLRDPADAEAARRQIRSMDPNLEINESQGGSVLEARMSAPAIEETTSQAIAQSIEIVRRRVDELGTTEPSIARQGQDRILLQVPGANAEDLKRIVGTTAKLTFHLLADPASRAPGGTQTLPLAQEKGGIDTGVTLEIQRRAMITGDMLENAAPAFDQNGQAVVSFRLNSVGARRFCDVTQENVNKPFAIVLDEEILSAPVIREPICGGSGQISGGFTLQSATDLSILLRAGALPAPLYVMEERTVGPSLGSDSVEAGKIAGLVGMALVLIFMVITYSLFGVFAGLALIVNVGLIFALLSMLQATLTLPGIAGIVLTIGMAVDANVLIFERIREELRAGRTPISAVDAGYRQAMATIIDANLTTLIAGIILFAFGTGPIKGFAVTLSIGIVTSMFSAIMVTRVMVVLWLRARKPGTLPI